METHGVRASAPKGQKRFPISRSESPGQRIRPYSSCSMAFISLRRVFSDTGPFRLITRETIHLMFYEKV
jgi:hypothetical protein